MVFFPGCVFLLSCCILWTSFLRHLNQVIILIFAVPHFTHGCVCFLSSSQQTIGHATASKYPRVASDNTAFKRLAGQADPLKIIPHVQTVHVVEWCGDTSDFTSGSQKPQKLWLIILNICCPQESWKLSWWWVTDSQRIISVLSTFILIVMNKYYFKLFCELILPRWSEMWCK